MSKEESNLIKIVTDSAVIVGLSAGVGFLAKKMMKESFLSDPSSNIMNYGKWVAVLSGATALKDYLEKQKILPKGV